MKIIYKNSRHEYRMYYENDWGESPDLVEEVTQIINESFSKELETTPEKTLNLLEKYEFILICFNQEYQSVVGYSLLRFFPEADLLNYSGLCVSSKNQGNLVGKRLLKLAWSYFKTSFISFTTQNPQIYQLYSILGFQLFPFDKKISKSVLTIANFIVNDDNFDYKTFVFKDKYSQCLYDKIPISNNEPLDKFFYERLGFSSERKSKDALLVIGQPLDRIKR
jgi:hypothetical protein